MNGESTTGGENGTAIETETIDLEELPETVWATTRNGTGVFHTEQCQFLPASPREWGVEAALEWGMRPCPRCLGDGVGGDHGRGGHYETLLAIGESRDAQEQERGNPWPRPAPADD